MSGPGTRRGAVGDGDVLARVGRSLRHRGRRTHRADWLHGSAPVLERRPTSLHLGPRPASGRNPPHRIGTLRQITRITPRRGPPVAVFNLEVDAEHVYYVSVDGVLVHNAYGDIPGEATISLKFIEGMNARDFARKVKSLQELGEAGELIRVMNPVARDPSVTANYRQDMINRIWQQYGQSNRDFANTLIDRVKRRMSPDHIHELQLGGSDVITNLRFMDRFTNWQIGTQQIRSQLRDLPVGTIIRVKIE